MVLRGPRVLPWQPKGPADSCFSGLTCSRDLIGSSPGAPSSYRGPMVFKQASLLLIYETPLALEILSGPPLALVGNWLLT